MEFDLQSAVAWIVEILNTQVFVVGTTSITIGCIVALILRWFFPNNKIINNQNTTIDILETENETLRNANEQLIADVETLKRQMDVVLSYSQNKHYKEARNLATLNEVQDVIQENINNLIKKTKKIKIKKGTE